MIDTLIKFPTRERPALFQRTLAQWQQDNTARFLITLDTDDKTCNTPAMRKWLDRQPRLKYRFGNCRTKIEAINDGVAGESWDLLIVASDDMIPQRPDYARYVAELFRKRFPDGDGVLHVNDGRAGRALNTLPIMGRAYFNRFGYVYHKDYLSVFADNEFQAVSESLGRAQYVDEIIFRHAWTDATGKDRLHLHNESFYQKDRLTFEARRAAGFPNNGHLLPSQ